MINRSAISAILFICSIATPSYAADEFNNWQNTLAPLYLWGASIEGTLNDQGITVDFDDAISDLNGIFTFHYEGARDTGV